VWPRLAQTGYGQGGWYTTQWVDLFANRWVFGVRHWFPASGTGYCRDTSHVAVGGLICPGRWREQFDELMGRIAGRFARVEPRRRARAFVLGLLSGLRRKNCWTIAEQAGDATPDEMQHLLAAARWDAGAVRDDVRDYVVEHLGSADAVLVVDETGDLKKGAARAGVQRQYSGTAGRVENCQVAVFLSYAAPAGHALMNTRSAAGAPGTAGPPWPCSPWRSLPSLPPPSMPVCHQKIRSR